MGKHRIKDEIPLSIIHHHNEVHKLNEELRNQLGELYYAISKAYIYGEISKRTGYCIKSIAFILNHTKMVN